MTFLEWEESYNIGIKEIDIQHRGLFDMISKLATTRRYDAEGRYFVATLNKFIEYTRLHFATEERYMHEAQYPKIAEHKQEHTQFLQQLERVAQSHKKEDPASEQKILNFLKEWYVDHILGTDREYQQTLLERGFR
jgi:hemerythrin